ncbi:hypothetical protein VSDG_06659 [Cytospora chrysosperma]|uniref:Rhodopsin domain-containing protein n=1 Tax=Cytospora chrysosperma TaxID=252740 RepID=A0A423VN79_CYTCH|nr:hypothetical protein VSDG_06659 [Valsa sordida]
MSLPTTTDPKQLTPEQQLQYAIDAGYPLQTPPAGAVPNSVNGDMNAYQLYITAGVCTPLIAIFSLFRLLNAIKFGRKTFVVDETIFVLGLVLCLACIAMSLTAIHSDIFGHHAWEVRLADLTQGNMMLFLLLKVFTPLATCAVKLSVLILYLRVFGGSLPWMRITCVVGIILLLGYHISFAIAFGAMCGPNPKAGYSQVAMLMAFIDLILLLLPLPVIWKLQMPLRRKVQTACIASLIGLAMRARYYRIDSEENRIVVPMWATGMAEMAAGIIVCCGPSAVAVSRAVPELPTVASWMSLGSRLTGSLGWSRLRFGTPTMPSDQAPSPSKQTEESPLRTFGGSFMPREGGWPVDQPEIDPRGGWNGQLIDNRPYALPDLFGSSVIFPPSMLPWLVSQPQSLLSAKHAQLDALNTSTMFLCLEIGGEPHHEPLVRRELTAHLDAVEASMWDEVGAALGQLWGEDSEEG